MGINWKKTEEYHRKAGKIINEDTIDQQINRNKIHVFVTCEVTGCTSEHNERLFEYSHAKKKVNKAKEEGGPLKCQSCAHAHRKGKASKRKPESKGALPLPPEVNAELTKIRFGYYPSELSAWSRKDLVVLCHECDKEAEIKRSYLNKYKCVEETGHYICGGCQTKARRDGVVASEETKRKQREAQQKRREIEKKLKDDDVAKSA